MGQWIIADSNNRIMQKIIWRGLEIMWKDYLILYPIFCLIGTSFEWCYGTLWNAVGTTPWMYTKSWLSYTSIEGIPLWGFGGLVCVSIYLSFNQRGVRLLSGAAISLVLAALWILLYSSLL